MTIRAFILSLLLVTTLAAQQPALAPKLHVADINPQPGYFNEPAIAVNPKDPTQAVVAWQINPSAAYTTDGGRQWKTAEGTAPPDYPVSGDVPLAYDHKGHAVLCYIDFDKRGTTKHLAPNPPPHPLSIPQAL